MKCSTKNGQKRENRSEYIFEENIFIISLIY